MIYIVGGKVDGKNILFLDKEKNAFQGSEKLDEARGLMPNLNGHHKAGYTWSCSASIWYITFNPCLYQFKDMKEIEVALVDMTAKEFRNVAGAVRAAVLKDDYKPVVVEKGSLIDERFNTAKPFYEDEK